MDERQIELRLKELWTFTFFLIVAHIAVVADAIMN